MKRKTRIGYLIDTIASDKAGTEKQLINLIRRLDKEAFEITLICLYESPWMRENELPCRTVTVGYHGLLSLSFPGVLARYLEIIRAGRFDVVQTFFEDSIFIGYLGRQLGRRHTLIVSRRDLGLGSDEPMYHRLYHVLLPHLFRGIDGIATNANAIKRHLVDALHVPETKVTVIENGLDLPAVSEPTPEIFLRHRGDLWVGLVANLKPVKRVDLFLHALAHLKGKRDSRKIRGVVLGGGRLAQYSQLAADLGIADMVHFAGAVGNVTQYLQHLDIGVLCSDKEGLSNAIIEYMACSLPVVATTVGGNPELVDGTNGVCIPAGNHVALAEALETLGDSPSLRRALGAKSLEKVRNRFTWDIIVPHWEAYYHSLCPH